MFQFSAYFKEVPMADKQFCDQFLSELKNAPNRIKDQIETAKDSPMFKQFADSLNEAEKTLGDSGFGGMKDDL